MVLTESIKEAPIFFQRYQYVEGYIKSSYSDIKYVGVSKIVFYAFALEKIQTYGFTFNLIDRAKYDGIYMLIRMNHQDENVH